MTMTFMNPIYIYIYIIYSPNLRSFASVLNLEQKQGRFNQTREEAARKSKKSSERARRSSERAKKSSKKTRKNNEKTQKKTQKSVLTFDYNCFVVYYVRFNQHCCLNSILKNLARLKQHCSLYILFSNNQYFKILDFIYYVNQTMFELRHLRLLI